MKKQFSILAMLFLFALAATFTTSCSKDDDPEPIVLPSTKEYAGSDKCETCHKAQYDVFIESGHPYKVMKINGQQPSIPFMPTALTPDGYTWNDISYTIGGYGWKMRFIDKNGYIITQVPGSQWNPANNSQTVYNSTVPNGTEKYTCGHCHTTGWVSLANGGSPQDGLPGMDGQFFAGGVQCEGCHGEGNVHIAARKANVAVPAGMDVTTDKTNTLCAKCHERRYATHDLKQQVSGGWEMHRSQIEQLSTNAHNSLTCTGCHNPHASTTKNALAKGDGIKPDRTCVSCHNNATIFSVNMHYGATCEQCHMPRTVKNGISYNKYKGDAPNHNFKINTSETDSYLTKDENDVLWANVNKKGSTLDFVCYQCHQDVDGVGGPNSMKTRAELSAKAVTFHKVKSLSLAKYSR